MASIRFSRLAAVPVYLIVAGVGSAAFMMYAFISSVYRIVEAGLGPLELILVGTVLEVSAFLFEVPTGVVADVYSRRLSLVLGSLLIGAGFILEGLFPLFGVILAAQVLWGVGWRANAGIELLVRPDRQGGTAEPGDRAQRGQAWKLRFKLAIASPRLSL